MPAEPNDRSGTPAVRFPPPLEDMMHLARAEKMLIKVDVWCKSAGQENE